MLLHNRYSKKLRHINGFYKNYLKIKKSLYIQKGMFIVFSKVKLQLCLESQNECLKTTSFQVLPDQASLLDRINQLINPMTRITYVYIGNLRTLIQYTYTCIIYICMISTSTYVLYMHTMYYMNCSYNYMYVFVIIRLKSNIVYCITLLYGVINFD